MLKLLKTRRAYCIGLLMLLVMTVAINTFYPSVYQPIPVAWLIANVAMNIVFLFISFMRCRAVGWSVFRLVAYVIPLANVVLIGLLATRRSVVNHSPDSI